MGLYSASRILNEAVFTLQRKACDPNRFSNRGGALLKEAKDRVRVQKMLPKVRSTVQGWI